MPGISKMISLDTNMLIRLVVNDNDAQSELAERLVRDNRVFISKTVLMESEWVLRHSYQYSRERIASHGSLILKATSPDCIPSP
jgi:predicted nucleic-acid-binding protein